MPYYIANLLNFSFSKQRLTTFSWLCKIDVNFRFVFDCRTRITFIETKSGEKGSIVFLGSSVLFLVQYKGDEYC